MLSLFYYIPWLLLPLISSLFDLRKNLSPKVSTQTATTRQTYANHKNAHNESHLFSCIYPVMLLRACSFSVWINEKCASSLFRLNYANLIVENITDVLVFSLHLINFGILIVLRRYCSSPKCVWSIIVVTISKCVCVSAICFLILRKCLSVNIFRFNEHGFSLFLFHYNNRLCSSSFSSFRWKWKRFLFYMQFSVEIAKSFKRFIFLRTSFAFRAHKKNVVVINFKVLHISGRKKTLGVYTFISTWEWDAQLFYRATDRWHRDFRVSCSVPEHCCDLAEIFTRFPS